MTNSIDRFWVARGINDITAVKGRSFFYAGFLGMAFTATILVGGIISNVATGLVA